MAYSVVHWAFNPTIACLNLLNELLEVNAQIISIKWYCWSGCCTAKSPPSLGFRSTCVCAVRLTLGLHIQFHVLLRCSYLLRFFQCLSIHVMHYEAITGRGTIPDGCGSWGSGTESLIFLKSCIFYSLTNFFIPVALFVCLVSFSFISVFLIG